MGDLGLNHMYGRWQTWAKRMERARRREREMASAMRTHRSDWWWGLVCQEYAVGDVS